MGDFRRRFPGYQSASEQASVQARNERTAHEQKWQSGREAIRASLEYLRDTLPRLRQTAQEQAVAVEISRRLGNPRVVAGWVFGSYYYPERSFASPAYTIHYAIMEDGRLVGGKLVPRGRMSGLVVGSRAKMSTVTELLGQVGRRDTVGDSGLQHVLYDTDSIKGTLPGTGPRGAGGRAW